jgi:hypothetical protein
MAWRLFLAEAVICLATFFFASGKAQKKMSILQRINVRNA